MQHVAIVALGANLGAPEETVRRALIRLRDLAEGEFQASSLWQSEPVDCPPGSPPFINAVAMFRPRADETPESLLEKLQALEREFGRTPKKIHNEPRTLDLDLIAFGNEVRQSASLTLPHPRAAQRAFVLVPLAEIAPDLILPGSAVSVFDAVRRMTQ